jgi:hypothetical protein
MERLQQSMIARQPRVCDIAEHACRQHEQRDAEGALPGAGAGRQRER